MLSVRQCLADDILANWVDEIYQDPEMSEPFRLVGVTEYVESVVLARC
jgi:hypothetical protein